MVSPSRSVGRSWRVAPCGCALIAALSGSAEAQETAKVEADAQTRTPTPAEQETHNKGDGFLDKAKAWAKKHRIAERLSGETDGWYPRLGRMTRGGGFALGPGYRVHPLGGPVLVDLSAGVSTKSYKSIDANVRWFQSADGRLEVWTDYRWEDFPQEDFFGAGDRSVLDGRTSYDFASHDVLARALVKPRPWLRAGANLGYMSVATGPGGDRQYPSIEERYTDVEAPGLLAQPHYLHSTWFAEVDYRDVPANPGSGGFYRLAYGVWNDRDLDAFDFRRLDLNLNQFVPLEPSKRHVLFARLGLSSTNNSADSRVPFYVLPYVGGVDTIRSFREFRFKDENAIWLGAEYLFRPSKYVSLAAFTDAGKVAHDWEDIPPTGLRKGYGVGVRFGTATQRLGRIDVGFGGGEGTRVFFKLGAKL